MSNTTSPFSSSAEEHKDEATETACEEEEKKNEALCMEYEAALNAVFRWFTMQKKYSKNRCFKK